MEVNSWSPPVMFWAGSSAAFAVLGSSDDGARLFVIFFGVCLIVWGCGCGVAWSITVNGGEVEAVWVAVV